MEAMTRRAPVTVKLSDVVTEKLQELYLQLKTTSAADRLWDQVFTADDKARLGENVDGGAADLWKRLHGCSLTRAVIDAAQKLDLITPTTQEWLLRETGEATSDPEEALQLAITLSDLVLTESPRSVYWRGALVPIDWVQNVAVWEYFLTLCTSAKAGKHVDASDFRQQRKPDYHVKMKSRLTGMPGFPLDLANLIEAERGGLQQLNIAREQIRLFQTESHDVLRELI